jgi:RNA polymerase sigma factor (sigma-70 family)
LRSGCPAPDQAEDLVQETFLRAYKSWDQYTKGTAAKSWLFTICRNVFLRGRERSSRHDDIVRESVGHEGPGPNPVNPVWVSVMGVDPEGDFFESIVDEQIIEAIDTLPEEYRTAVVLSDLEGLPYAEIAELMDGAGRHGEESALQGSAAAAAGVVRVRSGDRVYRGTHGNGRVDIDVIH